MIKNIMKKVIQELTKPENSPVRNLMVIEIALFLLYLICFILQHNLREFAKGIYLMRWGILGIAAMVWGVFGRREKRWKKKE